MKTWMKRFAAVLIVLLALSALTAQAEGVSGAGWSYSGTVLTITENISDYRLASSSSPWFIGTPFEREGIDHTVTEIIVTEGVTSIGDLAFYGMDKLTRVTFPSTLRNIGSGTFKRCTSLAEVTIPASVTSIGHAAFDVCSGLKTITFRGAPPSISTYDAFYDFNNTNPFVFSGCTADVYYKPYPSWTNSQIAAFSKNCYPTWYPLCDAHGSCGDNAQWYLIDGDQLVIRGSGDMTDYSWNGSPWKTYRNQIASVSVDAGITHIGSYAFSGGGATDRLVSISLPETVKSIGYSAFDHCTALQSISLPDSITQIGQDAFFGCYNLVSIDLPRNLETIGNSAFGSCYALQSLELPDTVVELGSYALANTEALQTIRLSAGLKTLSQGVLANAGLETVEIPQGVESISSSAFSGSTHLRSIIIPISVQKIENSAFSGHSETLVLSCHADSYAAQFAAEQGIATQIEPHDEITLPGKEPTCTEDGITEGVQCSTCGMMLAEQTAIPAAGHSYAKPVFVWEEDGSACGVSFICTICGDEQHPVPTISAKRVKEPDCVHPGETEYTATVEFGVEEIPDPENPDETIIVPCIYEGKTQLADIPALGHTEVVVPGFAPTCTESGIKDDIFCEVCGEELQTADELPPLGHTETVTVAALAPTCTEPGHTQETQCSVCGVLLTVSQSIPATGHTQYVSAEAVAPDCETVGHTQEIRCSVCQQVVTPSQPVPALGHTPETDAAVAPACESTGLTEGSHCAVCGKTLTAQIVLPATGHTPRIDEAVPPTDREPGLTQGSHCAVCGKTLVAQIVLPANFTWEGDSVVAYNGSSEDVVIPDGVTALGSTLFKNNTAIHTVRVPDSVTALGVQTFFGCTALTDLWLPDHLSKISVQAFYNVSARVHVTVGSATAIALSYRNVPFTTEDGMTLRYRVTSAAGTPTAVWLMAYTSDSESIVLPGTIGDVPLTQLQARALAACGRLKEIQIPDSVVSIAADTFEGIADTLIIRSSAHAYARTWAANNGFAWEHDLHSQDVLAAVKPSCTETGLTEGLWCAECGKVFTAQTVVDATGHTEVIDAGIAPTCTEDGLTEGKHCAVCGKVLVAQSVAPKRGHTEVVDAAVPPTCTEFGLTEGNHCSVCGMVFVEQNEVEAPGHTPITIEGVEPTCTEDGLSEYSYCTTCGEMLSSQEIIEALGHTTVVDAKVPPTCTEAGLTEGSHCSACGEVLIAQQVVPALGHNEKIVPDKAPTCTEAGNSEYYVCDNCGKYFVADGEGFTEVEKDSWIIAPIAHAHKTLTEAVAETCTTAGNSEYFTCDDCGKYFVADGEGFIEVEKDSWVIPKLSYHLMQDDACTMCGKRFDFTSMNVLTLPTGLKQIKEDAFRGNTAQVIVVPEGCQMIGDNAFSDCQELRYAVLPAAFVENAARIFGDHVPMLVVVCDDNVN